LQTLKTAVSTSFFSFTKWRVRRKAPDEHSLRVLFLNLSEGPKARDHQPDLWVYETHLTILWLGFQKRLAFTPGSSDFRAVNLWSSFPSGLVSKKEKCRKKGKKSQEVHNAYRRQVNYECKPTLFVVYGNKNVTTFLVGCHHSDDLFISISLFKPQLEHNPRFSVVSKP
jgi:hypothetical protein